MRDVHILVVIRCCMIARCDSDLYHVDCWGWFGIKMPSYQYRKSHCGDKTILGPSYFGNGISYTGKVTSLYWIRALLFICQEYTIRDMHSALAHQYFAVVHYRSMPSIYAMVSFTGTWLTIRLLECQWRNPGECNVVIMNGEAYKKRSK